MSLTAAQRALLHLYDHAGRDGVSCHDVGGAVWPDRTGRVSSANGGGDYAAQMLLGRLKKAALVEHAPSEGASRWRLSADGLREVHEIRGAEERPRATKVRIFERGAICATDPCACGHAPEEHGGDPEYPGSTSCTECDCIAYEADPEEPA